jgi:hypothetical protein
MEPSDEDSRPPEKPVAPMVVPALPEDRVAALPGQWMVASCSGPAAILEIGIRLAVVDAAFGLRRIRHAVTRPRDPDGGFAA